jgi:hypothetical protein
MNLQLKGKSDFGIFPPTNFSSFNIAQWSVIAPTAELADS